jgi:hypothetical protein
MVFLSGRAAKSDVWVVRATGPPEGAITDEGPYAAVVVFEWRVRVLQEDGYRLSVPTAVVRPVLPPCCYR